MRRVLLTASAALVLAVGCIPPPEDNDRIIDYKLDTAMGVIQDRGELRVGIERYHAPFGPSVLPDQGGFVVDFAEDVAEALGVDHTFAVVQTQQRLFGGVKDGTFDIVFSAVPITEELARRFAVTDPYYVGHQGLVVSNDSPIRDLSDLGSTGVLCTYNDESSSTDLGLHLEPSQLLRKATLDDCFEAFSREEVDAVSARDIEVLRLTGEDRGFLFVGEQLSTEGYGALVLKDPPGLAEFVNGVLAEAKAEGRWQQWYRAWIAPRLDGSVPEPPTMTAEEAAALYPAEVDS